VSAPTGLDLEDEHEGILPDVALAEVARDALERGTYSDAAGAGMALAEGPTIGDVASAPGQNPAHMPSSGAPTSQASALAQLLR
jgi:hypothetical protein